MSRRELLRVMLRRGGGGIPIAWRLVLAVVSGTSLVFCVFGFRATFEPLPLHTQVLWRGVYGVGGLVTGATLGWVLGLAISKTRSTANASGAAADHAVEATPRHSGSRRWEQTHDD